LGQTKKQFVVTNCYFILLPSSATKARGSLFTFAGACDVNPTYNTEPN
jgi:hypothetical protein